MIAIDLSKHQALDADARAIQQIKFTAIQQCFSLLKPKKLSQTFHKELQKFCKCVIENLTFVNIK